MLSKNDTAPCNVTLTFCQRIKGLFLADQVDALSDQLDLHATFLKKMSSQSANQLPSKASFVSTFPEQFPKCYETLCVNWFVSTILT